MLLGDLIPLIHYDQTIEIYTEDDYGIPFFRGHAMDMPWHLMELEIGCANPKADEPIYSYTDKIPNKMPCLENINEDYRLEDVLVILTREPSLRDPQADFPQ